MVVMLHDCRNVANDSKSKYNDYKLQVKQYFYGLCYVSLVYSCHVQFVKVNFVGAIYCTFIYIP